MALVLFSMFSRVYQADAPTMPPDFSNTAALGKLMFTDYIYPLEIAAAILVVLFRNLDTIDVENLDSLKG
ncbi:MAG: hypothetical protein EBX17_09345 [Betaproteobacteria bacterium]|nr:hypothetical protein [Betaproteobacteria bacterium]